MAAAVASIGLMDSAYFVGRGEILSWINATLQLSLAKVEEVSPRPRIPIPPLPCARLSAFLGARLVRTGVRS
jgi:hypothetical protein